MGPESTLLIYGRKLNDQSANKLYSTTYLVIENEWDQSHSCMKYLVNKISKILEDIYLINPTKAIPYMSRLCFLKIMHSLTYLHTYCGHSPIPTSS